MQNIGIGSGRLTMCSPQSSHPGSCLFSIVVKCLLMYTNTTVYIFNLVLPRVIRYLECLTYLDIVNLQPRRTPNLAK